MKIGMISEFYYPKSGGISEHIRSLSRELESRGHEVVVITGRRDGNVPEIGPRVETLGRSVEVPYNGSLSSITIGRGLRGRMRELLRRELFDLIHVHNPLMPTLPLLALETAEQPVVATLHSNYPHDIWVDFFRVPLRRLWSRVGIAVPVSLAAHRSVAGHFQADYRIIPNGVDFQAIQEACLAAGRQGAAGPLLPSSRAPRILFVGASVPRKGLTVLVRAFARLRDRGVRAELIVAGDGPGTDRARGLVPDSLRADVRFLGALPRAQLLDCYASCDLFCAPSLGRESFGMILLEAMAAGLPVAASDIDGYRDVVSQGEEGVLVPPGDPEILARTLEALLLDPGLRHLYGARGRRKARGYAWPAIAGQVEEVYRQVLGLPPALDRRRDGVERGSGLERTESWSHALELPN